MSDIEGQAEIYKILKSPARQGAATYIWAAVAKELEGKGGLYLDDVAETEPTPPPQEAPYWAGGYGTQAFDASTEKKLWTSSLNLIGLSD